MVFGYTTLNDAVAQVQSKCMDKGWMVSSQTTNQVVCEIPMGIFQAALTQMLVGNSYSTTPEMFTRFSLAQVGDHTRVQTQTWAETQMAFGQMQQQAYSDDGTYNNMLGFLAESGAQFPVGTTFTSRAYLGVEGDDATWMNGRRSAYGYRIKNMIVGAPGSGLGLHDGDVVTEINGRGLRNTEAFTAALDRQRVGQAITITIQRDGQEMTLTGVAKGRPTITQIIRNTDVPPDLTPTGAQIAVATFGGVDQMYERYTATHPGYIRPAPVVMAQAAAPETEIERMRREAAEAQARLAAAEAAAGSAAGAPK